MKHTAFLFSLFLLGLYGSLWAQYPSKEKSSSWHLTQLTTTYSHGLEGTFSGTPRFFTEQLWNNSAAFLIPNDSLIWTERYRNIPRLQVGLNLQKRTRQGSLRYFRMSLEFMPPQQTNYYYFSPQPDVSRRLSIRQGEINFLLDYTFVKEWKRLRLQAGVGMRGGGSVMSRMNVLETTLVELDSLAARGQAFGQVWSNGAGLFTRRGTVINFPGIRPSIFYRVYVPVRLEVKLLPGFSLELGAEGGLGLQYVLGGSIYGLPAYGRVQVGCLFLLRP